MSTQTNVNVNVQQVSNGFIVTQQGTNPPFKATIQVFADFPSATSALATIFGVSLPVSSITSAIAATLAATQTVTATPTVTPVTAATQTVTASPTVTPVTAATQ